MLDFLLGEYGSDDGVARWVTPAGLYLPWTIAPPFPRRVFRRKQRKHRHKHSSSSRSVNVFDPAEPPAAGLASKVGLGFL